MSFRSTLALLAVFYSSSSSAAPTMVNITQYKDSTCQTGGVVFSHTLGACDKGHLFSCPTATTGNVTEATFSPPDRCKGTANDTESWAQGACVPMAGSVKYKVAVCY